MRMASAPAAEWRCKRTRSTGTSGRHFLDELADEYRSTNNYDILIPVSGGKDSYYQTHVAVHELGLKPLLVTYHGNNYLPEGEDNLQRMREVFDCDHIIFKPGVDDANQDEPAWFQSCRAT